MMALVTLLGGFRATGFAVAVLILGGILAWQNAVTIPGLRVDLADAKVALADEKAAHAGTVAELSKAVTAANANAAELKRVTQDAAAEKVRTDAARKAAEDKARLSNARLEDLRKELANAKAEDDAPVAPALARVIDGLRRP